MSKMNPTAAANPANPAAAANKRWIEKARDIAGSQGEGLQRDKALQALYNSAVAGGAGEVTLAYISGLTGWGRKTCEAHRALAEWADGDLAARPTGLPWRSMRSAYVRLLQQSLKGEYHRLFEPMEKADTLEKRHGVWLDEPDGSFRLVPHPHYEAWYYAFRGRQGRVFSAQYALGEVWPRLRRREREGRHRDALETKRLSAEAEARALGLERQAVCERLPFLLEGAEGEEIGADRKSRLVELVKRWGEKCGVFWDFPEDAPMTEMEMEDFASSPSPSMLWRIMRRSPPHALEALEVWGLGAWGTFRVDGDSRVQRLLHDGKLLVTRSSVHGLDRATVVIHTD